MHGKFLAFLVVLTLPFCARGQELETLLQSGDDRFFHQETDEALRYYEKAYAIAPRNDEILLRLVRAQCDLGWLHLHTDTSSQSYYLHAAAFAESLLALNPSSPAAHFWVSLTQGSLIPFGSISEKMSRGKEVRFHAERAIELDSTFALAYVVLAVFERESSKLSWFERTIARVIFGEDLHGSLARSEELLEKAVQCDPGSSYAFYEMYFTKMAMGDKDGAAESLKKVLSLPVRSEREERQHQHAQERLAELDVSAR